MSMGGRSTSHRRLSGACYWTQRMVPQMMKPCGTHYCRGEAPTAPKETPHRAGPVVLSSRVLTRFRKVLAPLR
jgi:hypothetical protein